MTCFSKLAVICSTTTLANGEETKVSRHCSVFDLVKSKAKKIEEVHVFVKQCKNDDLLQSEKPIEFSNEC